MPPGNGVRLAARSRARALDADRILSYLLAYVNLAARRSPARRMEVEGAWHLVLKSRIGANPACGSPTEAHSPSRTTPLGRPERQADKLKVPRRDLNYVQQSVGNMSTLRRREPRRGLPPADISTQTRTPAARGAAATEALRAPGQGELDGLLYRARTLPPTSLGCLSAFLLRVRAGTTLPPGRDGPISHSLPPTESHRGWGNPQGRRLGPVPTGVSRR